MPVLGTAEGLKDEIAAQTFPVSDQTETSNNRELITIEGVTFRRTNFYNAANEIVRRTTWSILNDTEIDSIALSAGDLLIGTTETFTITSTGSNWGSTSYVEYAFENNVLLGGPLGRLVDQVDFNQLGFNRVGIVRATGITVSNDEISGTIDLRYIGWGTDPNGSLVRSLHKPTVETIASPYSTQAVRPFFIRVLQPFNSTYTPNPVIATDWFQVL